MFNPSQLYMPLRSLAPIARNPINWATLLTNTQKTLNIVNQAIPIVYQVKPIINNAKTMLKVASAFTKSNNSNNNTNTNTQVSNNNYINNDDYNEGPSFFI